MSGSELKESDLLEALRPPVPRSVFDAAVNEVCDSRRARAAGGSGNGGPGIPEVTGDPTLNEQTIRRKKQGKRLLN